MREYQTCTLSPSGQMSLYATGRYASDKAAIQEAHVLCRPGETAEVWRDGVCIYQDTPPARAVM